MTVRSMMDVMESFGTQHLAQAVPEDVDVIMNLSTVAIPEVCSDGHIHDVVMCVRIHLWVKFPDGPCSESLPAITTECVLPAWHLEDGDVEPLAFLLDQMWQRIQFTSITSPSEPLFHEILAEAGVEDSESGLDEEG